MNRDDRQVLLNSLVVTLEDMVKAYRLLLDLVRQEKDILVSSDLAQLNQSNQAKEMAIDKIRELEEVRIIQAQKLAEHLNCDIERPRLLDIAMALGGSDGDRLRSLHSVLDLLLKRVREMNQANELLAESALKNLGGAIDSIKDTLHGKKTVYERKGSMKQQSHALGAFVSKEA